jgi:hypothetical protein
MAGCIFRPAMFSPRQTARGVLRIQGKMLQVTKWLTRNESECERCEKTPKASTVKWKGLYAGRHRACTAVIEATGATTLLLRLCTAQDHGHNSACVQKADHPARLVGRNAAVSESACKIGILSDRLITEVIRKRRLAKINLVFTNRHRVRGGSRRI